MKTLIVAEKPSVGRSYAHALHVSGNHDGYIENDKWVITWAIGHLLELSYPEKYDEKYKSWNIDDLPFLPEDYKYEPIPAVKGQLKTVCELLNRKDIDTVMNAGDSAREGELIQRIIYRHSKVSGKKMLRIWIDSMTDEEILKGIKNARPAAEFDLLYEAGLMRSISDYATGINLSRALTCKYGYEFNQKIKSSKYTAISVGRVMTCVLGMIVQREREIKNFVPTDFYKIDAEHPDYNFTSHWKVSENSRFFNSDKLYNDTGLKEKKDAEGFVEDLSNDPVLTVSSAKSALKKRNAPLLYNLAELQADCSRRFKISPDKTLETAQSLYEKGYTTYPRTDARVLSTAVAKEIDNNLSGLKENVPEVAKFIEAIFKMGADKTIADSKYCDDSKISDHHAIIPTGIGDVSTLDGLEEKVYMCIVRRFVAIFCPPAEYKTHSLELTHSSGELFTATETVLIKAGFLAVTGKSEEDSTEASEIGKLTEGMKINADFKLIESKTQPPKRYTSGSMILAMENAGKLIEDVELREQIISNGIGTSATRAETIKKLCSNSYILLNNKTQILTPTNIGEGIYDIVYKCLPDMLSPKTTASWEKGLSQIQDGTITADYYRKVFEKDIRKKVTLIKEQVSTAPPKTERKEVGVCPICGNKVMTSRFGWMCTGYKKDDPKSCKFSVPYEAWGHKLTEDEMNTLLSGNETEEIDFVKKSGEHFRSKLVVANGRVDRPTENAGICPSCGGVLVKDEYTYKCTACDFKVWNKIGNREITMPEYLLLFTAKISSKMDGFCNKDGASYSGYLVFRKNKIHLVKSEINGYEITPEDLEKLQKDGKTDEKSMTSKLGKTFQAKIKLSANGFTEFEFNKKGKKNG